VHKYFPHDPRFNHENFGNTPINIIFQALEYGHRFYKEDLHYQELGMATLTSYFVNANKDPKKGSGVTPSDFFYFKPDSSSDISPDVATTFFSLVKDGVIPDWAVSLIPIKELVALKDKGRIARKRAFVGVDCNILVLCPSVVNYKLFCGFLAIWEVDRNEHSSILLQSVDNPEDIIRVVTPESESGLLTMSYSNYYLVLTNVVRGLPDGR
jgi:hypothetical protein